MICEYVRNLPSLNQTDNFSDPYIKVRIQLKPKPYPTKRTMAWSLINRDEKWGYVKGRTTFGRLDACQLNLVKGGAETTVRCLQSDAINVPKPHGSHPKLIPGFNRHRSRGINCLGVEAKPNVVNVQKMMLSHLSSTNQSWKITKRILKLLSYKSETKK